MLGSCGLNESASSASRSAAGAMCTVWNAPATLSGIRRARGGGFSARPASCSIVPAATIWPLPLLLAGVRPWAAIAASTSSGLPPITAVIDVGVVAARFRHRAAPLPDEHHGLVVRQRTHEGRRGDLADGVTGDHADAVHPEAVCPVRCLQELPSGQQTGGHQQRLGHGGVADGVGVGLGAVVAQIELGDRREPIQSVGEGLLGQPGSQEPGSLCALTGRDDGQHDLDYFVTFGCTSRRDTTNLGLPGCRNLTKGPRCDAIV